MSYPARTVKGVGRRWTTRTRAALVSAALLLGACATSDGSTDGADATPATTDPAPTGSTSSTAPREEPPPTAEDEPTGDLPEGRDVVVTSITDGDTFRAGEERVRLTGIDTPEISSGVECYGREATDALTALIPPGSEVRLVLDVEPEDRYDRTLAYVYRLRDGAFVNLALARDGFATPLTIPPNVAHADDFVDAARGAREGDQGLWSACADQLDPGDLPPSTTTGPAGTTPSAGGCDPAYPDVCIPPAPPDLDCGDIPDRDFTVLVPDPHRFDGGGDGRGCERP